jgi:hypothetical protein
MRTHSVRTGAWAACAVALLLMAAGTGCSDDDGSPAALSNIYQGGFADSSGRAGSLSFTIQEGTGGDAARVMGDGGVPVTGEIIPAGESPIPLTGSYDPQSLQIHLSSNMVGSSVRGGGGYYLNGQRGEDGTFVGPISTPFGSGSWIGVGVAAISEASVLCGVYNCETGCDGASDGYFQLVTFGSDAVAGIVSFAGDVATLLGTVSGSTVSFDYGDVTASGTLSGGSVAGTYSDANDGSSGSWNGSEDACGAVRR